MRILFATGGMDGDAHAPTPIGCSAFTESTVGALLGLSREELLHAIRYLSSEGGQYSGADALLMLAREFWWLRSITWIARVPGMRRMMFVAYEGIARRRNCQAQIHGALKGMADENHVC